MFAPGQGYVAISRAKTWDSINIIALDRNAIKTDEQVIKEYERLQKEYDKLKSSFIARILNQNSNYYLKLIKFINYK